MENKIKIIPFRIKPSIQEDDYSEVYEFLIKGTKKTPYEIEISIDDLNDLGITKTRCNCIDCSICRSENAVRYKSKDYQCKHIKHCISILKEFEIGI